jgi:hypothetical protein
MLAMSFSGFICVLFCLSSQASQALSVAYLQVLQPALTIDETARAKANA